MYAKREKPRLSNERSLPAVVLDTHTNTRTYVHTEIDTWGVRDSGEEYGMDDQNGEPKQGYNRWGMGSVEEKNETTHRCDGGEGEIADNNSIK